MSSQKDANSDKYEAIISTLPRRKGMNSKDMINYENFWYQRAALPSFMAIHDNFQPHPTDVFVATFPKSGNTWLKAILFSVANRKQFPSDDSHHPILTSSPHALVPFLNGFYIASDGGSKLEDLSSPWLLAFHAPYSLLPSSLTNSDDCRIIYMCREPKDSFVSLWHYLNKLYTQAMEPFEEAFNMFCEGCSLFGPLWEHALEYWKASLERPDRICFVKYEEMKKEPVETVRRIAEFAGFVFSEKEVEEGVVEGIVNLCSFKKLSNVKVNASGGTTSGSGYPTPSTISDFPPPITPTITLTISGTATGPGTGNIVANRSINHEALFRKGEVGGWEELLTPEMAERLDRITEDKFRGSGLAF